MKSWLSHENASNKSPELKLNITQLMVGMMMVDEHLDEFEYAEIKMFLTDSFGLSNDESIALIEQVKGSETNTTVFEKNAQHITSNYSIDERAYILSIVWRIALVDGEVSFREEQYLNRLADLLSVPSSTLEALKKEQEKDFPDLDVRDRYEEF